MACVCPLGAQVTSDSARAAADSAKRVLATVRVEASRTGSGVSTAPRLAAGIITTGAKSEVVKVTELAANLSEKSARQIFAEVPGIFVYDMDGSGNQVNVSARSLDPHRSWEFNVRQNGVPTLSDEYGYPASHYSAPMEAVERVELIRGTTALQYGSQFGGLLNYVIKSPDTTRAISGESRSSAGSYGLLSTWNAAGGKIGRVTYYAYFALRGSDGYRASGESKYDAEYLSVSMPLSPTLSLRADVGRSAYLYQQPGPLNDAMFAIDPRDDTRTRNWYSPDITVPSATLTWTPSDATRSTLLLSGVFGTRNSVAVGGFATTPDEPNASGVWSPRQVDLDRYTTRTVEWRLQHRTHARSTPVTLSGGLAYADNDMRRRQQGIGSRGSDYDLTIAPGTDFRRDLHYRTRNLAAYVEAEVGVTPRWTIVPGLRVERGTTNMTGRLAYYDPADTPTDIRHDFPLAGIRSVFTISTGAEWYGGFSQAYRPMILKDVLPETSTERTDPNLQDARGWTVESGVRGTAANVNYDLGVFVMHYGDRFGMLTVADSTGTPYTYKTNVGTTRTMGFEGRASVPFGTTRPLSWRAFTALSLMHARYAEGSVVSVGRNVDISGNEVESAPGMIARGGLSAYSAKLNATLQASRVSHTYADALNTDTPGTTGAVGSVPAHTVVDLNAGYWLTSQLQLSAGINNLLDVQYFTKRPQFYPGPGVWPSDGRTVQLSVSLRAKPY